jgi:putative ATPase
MLNMIEQVHALPAPVDPAVLAAAVQKRAPLYDKTQEGHYKPQLRAPQIHAGL